MEKQFIDLNKQTPPATDTNATPAPAASEAVPATINATSTGEPVTEQVPATSEASTPEIAASETPASTAAAEDIRNDSGLPSGYLADGWTDEQGILRREYVENYAEEIAEKLKGMRASTYHLAFLSEAKTLRKKKTPYSQQKLCTMQMATAAKKLTSRKKDPAPAILLEVIKAATEAVVDSETFQMLYLHLDAIYSYLLDN